MATLATRLSHLPPFFLTGTALIIGGAIMAPGWRSWRVPIQTIILGCLALILYHAALFTALKWAPSVSANLINYLWPLLIVVLAPIVQKDQRLSLRMVLAGLTGFGGAALAISGDNRVQFDIQASLGYALAFCAALIWSTYSLLLKRLPSFPNAAVGIFNLGAGLIAFSVAFFTEPNPVFRTNDWIYIILIGVGPLGMAFFFWDRAAKTLTAAKLGILSFLTPVCSTTLLLIATENQPSIQLAAGGMLVVIAIMLALWQPRKAN